MPRPFSQTFVDHTLAYTVDPELYVRRINAFFDAALGAP
jgi:hypothetical protein